jgi:hypothetical protein
MHGIAVAQMLTVLTQRVRRSRIYLEKDDYFYRRTVLEYMYSLTLPPLKFVILFTELGLHENCFIVYTFYTLFTVTPIYNHLALGAQVLSR